LSTATVQRTVLAIELSTHSWATLEKGSLQECIAHIVSRDATPGIRLASGDYREISVVIEPDNKTGLHRILVEVHLDSHESSQGALQGLMACIRHSLQLLKPQLVIQRIGFQ